MSNHAIEIVCATSQAADPPSTPTPEPPSYSGTIPDRVDQNVKGTFAAVLTEEETPAETNDPIDGTTHVRGHYRFDFAEDKTSLIDAIENDVVIDAEWYEVRYHECDHDQADRSGCPSWSTERSNGTIPDDV